MRIVRALAHISSPNSTNQLPAAQLSETATQIIAHVAKDQFKKSRHDAGRVIASVALISIAAEYLDGFIAYDLQAQPQTSVWDEWTDQAESIIADTSALMPSVIQKKARSLTRQLIEDSRNSKSAAAILNELKAITVGLVVEYPHRDGSNGRFQAACSALDAMIGAVSDQAMR